MLNLMPVVLTHVEDLDMVGLYTEVISVVQWFPGNPWNAGSANMGGLGSGYSRTQVGYISGTTYPRYAQETGWLNC